MNVWESLRIALRALGRNKMRTALTMLGMIIGVSAVITLVALGAGATRKVTASISALGTNLITVMPESPRLRFGGLTGGGTTSGMLTEEDALAIARHLRETVVAVAPVARGGVMVKLGNRSAETTMIGTTQDYRQVNNAPVSLGRFLSEADVNGRLKVAVLGTSVVEQLLGDAKADPVGLHVQVNRVSFRVVGVLKTKGSGSFGQDQDDTVIVPVSTALRRVLNRDFLNSINVEAASKESMDLAVEQMSRLLRQRHRLRPPFPDSDDFEVRSQTGLLEAFQTAVGTMTSLLAGIAVVSLVVGGIGIMNIMLVSVTERTREIGIRRAIGARRRDILLQFLVESIILSVMGGILGVLSGIGSSFLISHMASWPTHVSTLSVLGAFSFSGAVGVFFGFYPARKASLLNPIDALRYE
jgi:putative ABC transport system permease protein